MSQDKILSALAKLDPKDDSHWTKGGAPAMEAVEAIVGSNLTRDEVNQAAPEFTREAAISAAADAGNPDPAGVDGELNEKQVAVSKLKAANEALAKAKADQVAAQAEVDRIAMAEEVNRPSFASSVKAFQKAQFAEKMKRVEQENALKEALKQTAAK